MQSMKNRSRFMFYENHWRALLCRTGSFEAISQVVCFSSTVRGFWQLLQATTWLNSFLDGILRCISSQSIPENDAGVVCVISFDILPLEIFNRSATDQNRDGTPIRTSSRWSTKTDICDARWTIKTMLVKFWSLYYFVFPVKHNSDA